MAARIDITESTPPAKWFHSSSPGDSNFLFNGGNNWNTATASLIYESLTALGRPDYTLFGNTIFLVGKSSNPA
jgi:hypothetical protein